MAVADQHSHPVTGLGKENFRVFDDGVERIITSFAMDDEPVAVGLIFDQSSSVGRATEPEATATRLFLHISNPEDEFFLVIFATRPELTLPLTREPEKIQDRVFTIKSGGTTALFDAVILGLEELKKSKLSRKALLSPTVERTTAGIVRPNYGTGWKKARRAHLRRLRPNPRHRFSRVAMDG